MSTLAAIQIRYDPSALKALLPVATRQTVVNMSVDAEAPPGHRHILPITSSACLENRQPAKDARRIQRASLTSFSQSGDPTSHPRPAFKTLPV